jgi:H+/Cl- antiporter ClcA
MQTQETFKQTYSAGKALTQQLFVTICLGLTIGALVTAFLKSLELIANQHQIWNAERWPIHIFFLPVVLLVLHLLKKRTLYFPSKVSELIEWKSESCRHWSAWMTPFKLLGTLLSHLAGASVGREGVAVIMAAGLVRIFQLQWSYWGPIAMGAGFAAILGNPWIGVVFISELLRTNLRQKTFTLISSCVAFLIMQTLKVSHLIPKIEIQLEIGFFKTLFFVTVLAVSVGFIMRFYKWTYKKFSQLMKKHSIFIKLVFAFILAALLMTPELRSYQSLSLFQIQDLNNLKIGFEIPLLKLFLTLFSLVLGFWGGEFIPLVFTGLHFGASLAHILDYPQMVGAYLGCYLFFAAATRLKWTTFFLILSLMGFSWCLWLLVLINMCVGFSGDESLYKSNE